ncbi:PREDICTED: serine/threonine-protein phosphatase 6 regulatory ankyrin repeat subunit A [Prunus mume]|uniref:Serine/threonine-protein phosphatase 6 regulatory ankyrin repeat subunit A n=1 Tax=Prunus mume TaxID=102107 RepID=A0ABM1LUE2_PRUMU|nr:PREDICTED: serine/threonine-protein phosphatase 6 regulatory ankyrin repeat subunit A [Prunus mume]
MGNPQKSSSWSQNLHTAARSGDLTAVQSILSSNPLAVNSRDKHSRTPLHLAAWSGQTEVVNFLCSHKADVGAAAMDDMGAIHFAAQKGHLEVVRTLLLSGASVKAYTRKGLTPLHYAVQGAHVELIKYLVKKGANLSAKTKAGKTSSEKGGLNEKQKDEESDPNTSLQEEVKSEGEAANSGNDKPAEDGSLKRKTEKDDSEEASGERKKPRVVLSHLLSADDTQDEE